MITAKTTVNKCQQLVGNLFKRFYCRYFVDYEYFFDPLVLFGEQLVLCDFNAKINLLITFYFI